MEWILSIENSIEKIDEPQSTDFHDENLEQADSESTSTAGSYENEYLDPKVRKGMERIKKLDNILCEKIKVIVEIHIINLFIHKHLLYQLE